jgi:hypothetical protein
MRINFRALAALIYSLFASAILFADPDLFGVVTAGIVLAGAYVWAILRPDLSLPHRDSMSRSDKLTGIQDGRKAKSERSG